MKRVGPGATQQEGLNFWHHDGGGGPTHVHCNCCLSAFSAKFFVSSAFTTFPPRFATTVCINGKLFLQKFLSSGGKSCIKSYE